MDRIFRSVFLVVGIAQALLGVGFALQITFITQIWPIPNTGPMSLIFIGSIFAAAAASTLWCLFAGENGSLVGVYLDYIAIFIPLTLYFLMIANGDGSIAMFGAILLLGAVYGAVSLWWSLRFRITDRRPQPMAARIGFAVFVGVLILVGISMVLQVPNILPWKVSPDSSVIYGYMFLGAAVYFAHAFARPSWANSGGQLAGFLAYDVILLVPFIQHFSKVEDHLMPNLIIYFAVVVVSGLLATYYLFVNKETRMTLLGPVA